MQTKTMKWTKEHFKRHIQEEEAMNGPRSILKDTYKKNK